MALFGIEQVGHQAPGERNDEQVHHRQPDVKRPRDPDVVGIDPQARRKAGHDQSRECIEDRKQLSPGHARRNPAVQRHDDERRQERSGEQPLQVLDAAGDAERLAHRPQHEVRREQEEEQEETGGDCRYLLALRGNQAAEKRASAAVAGRLRHSASQYCSIFRRISASGRRPRPAP
jgi:hypothetical protein